MKDENKLNILNGQAMYDYFMQNHLNKDGVYIPFNEAMCVGSVSSVIFSSQFIRCRCDAHHVSLKQYNEITLEPLKSIFKNKFANIDLWFDDDMFCQINLLTVLTFLDQKNYSGHVTFNLVNLNYKVIDSFKINVRGYKEIYKQVMINKCMPENIVLPVMEKGTKLYFEYLKEENEITSYIRQHKNLDCYILLKELINNFRQYGLGDTQYIQLIKKCRKA
jgi:hypothetical protein